MNLWNYTGEQQKRSLQISSAVSAGWISSTTCACASGRISTPNCAGGKELGIPVNSEPAEYREIHIALLTGLLSHIGMKDADKQEFTGARNARFSIFPAPGCLKAAEVDHGRRAGGNQPSVGRIAARIDPEWVEPVAQHLLKRSYSEPHWERGQGAVMATEKSPSTACRWWPRVRLTTARSIRR